MRAIATFKFNLANRYVLSSNGGHGNRYAKAEIKKHLRLIARLKGREWVMNGGCGFERCFLTASIGYATSGRADPPNLWPTVKPLVDGLVDAGVLPDDSDEFIPLTAFKRDPVKAPKGTHTVTVTLKALDPEETPVVGALPPGIYEMERRAA